MEVFTAANNADSTFGSIVEPSESFCRRVFRQARRPTSSAAQNNSNNNNNTVNEESEESTLSNIPDFSESVQQNVLKKTGRPPAVNINEESGLGDIMVPTESIQRSVLRKTARPPQHVVLELRNAGNEDSSEVNDTHTRESFRTPHLKKQGVKVSSATKEPTLSNKSASEKGSLVESESDEREPKTLPECSVRLIRLEPVVGTKHPNETSQSKDAEDTSCGSTSKNRTQRVERLENHTHLDLRSPRKIPSVPPQEVRSLNMFQDSFDINQLDNSGTIITRPRRANNISNKKRRRYQHRKSQKAFDDTSTDTSDEERDSIYELPQKTSKSTASNRTLAAYNDVISQGFSKVSSTSTTSRLKSSQEVESAHFDSRQSTLKQGTGKVPMNRYLESDVDSSDDQAQQAPISYKTLSGPRGSQGRSRFDRDGSLKKNKRSEGQDGQRLEANGINGNREHSQDSTTKSNNSSYQAKNARASSSGSKSFKVAQISKCRVNTESTDLYAESEEDKDTDEISSTDYLAFTQSGHGNDFLSKRARISKERSQKQIESLKQKLTNTSAAKQASNLHDTDLADSEQSDEEVDPMDTAKHTSASKERSQTQARSSKRKLTNSSSSNQTSKLHDTKTDSEKSDRKVDPMDTAKPTSASKERSQTQTRSSKRKLTNSFAAKQTSKLPDTDLADSEQSDKEVDPMDTAKHTSASKESSQTQARSSKRKLTNSASAKRPSKYFDTDTDLADSEQSYREVEPMDTAKPTYPSKERSQVQARSSKRKLTNSFAAKQTSKLHDTDLTDTAVDPTVAANPTFISKETSLLQTQLQSPRRKLPTTSAAKQASKLHDTDLADSEQSDTEVDPVVVDAAKPTSASKERSQMQARSSKQKLTNSSSSNQTSKLHDTDLADSEQTDTEGDPMDAAKPTSASKMRSQMQARSSKRKLTNSSSSNQTSKLHYTNLTDSEQSDRELDAAKPASASKERSQMQVQSLKQKSTNTAAKSSSKLHDTDLTESEQSDREVDSMIMPKPISASTPKAVRTKPKTASVDQQLAKFQGNANMITKVKIESYLKCLGLNMPDKKLQAVTKISNAYIEKVLDRLCSLTENTFGTWSFSELAEGLQTEKLLPGRSNALAFEFASAFTPIQLRRMDGILTPEFNENDTYFT